MCVWASVWLVVEPAIALTSPLFLSLHDCLRPYTMEDKMKKIKLNESKLVRHHATKKLQNNPDEEEEGDERKEALSPRSTGDSTSIPSSSRRYPALMTCDIKALETICEEANIDLTNLRMQELSVEKRREDMILALIATDPSEHDRVYFKKLSHFINRVPNSDSDDSVAVAHEVNEMFELLLKKFEVTKILRTELLKSFSIEEKIQHLQSSIW
jgi:hypothetical protein